MTNRSVNPFGSPVKLTLTPSLRIDSFTHTPFNPNQELHPARKIMWNLIRAKQALGEWPKGEMRLLGSVGDFFTIQHEANPELFLISIKYCVDFTKRQSRS